MIWKLFNGVLLGSPPIRTAVLKSVAGSATKAVPAIPNFYGRHALRSHSLSSPAVLIGGANRQHFDLDMNPTRERGDLDRRAGGANLAQILGVDCVVGGEVFVEIREEAGDINDVFEAGSGGF